MTTDEMQAIIKRGNETWLIAALLKREWNQFVRPTFRKLRDEGCSMFKAGLLANRDKHDDVRLN